MESRKGGDVSDTPHTDAAEKPVHEAIPREYFTKWGYMPPRTTPPADAPTPLDPVVAAAFNDTPELFMDACLQVYARTGMYPQSRRLHDAAMAYRAELIRRVTENAALGNELEHAQNLLHIEREKVAAFKERVRQAVDAECSCGGAAKGQIGCPACGVYHRLTP